MSRFTSKLGPVHEPAASGAAGDFERPAIIFYPWLNFYPVLSSCTDSYSLYML